jgi:hypothetical protein
VFASFVFTLVLLVTLTVFFYRGNRLMKSREELLERIGSEDNEHLETLGVMSYHGGFPEIPKPQKLTIGLGNSYLVLLTNKGAVGKSPLSCWQNIEHFSILVKHDPKQRSMVLWGPLNNIMFKDRKRHFITIKYEDPDGQENNLLLEYSSKEKLKEIFDKLNSRWKMHRLSA